MSVTVTVVSCLYGNRGYQRFALAWRHSIRQLEREPDQVIVGGDWHSRIPPSVTSVVNAVCPWRYPQAFHLQNAVMAAETDWVWILDFDDIALADALNGIDDVDADVWMMGYQRSGGEVYVPSASEAELELPRRCLIPAGSAIRTEAFHRAGGFQDLAFQDWALWRALARTGASFESSGRVHYRYNRHPATRTAVELTPEKRAEFYTEMKIAEEASLAVH